MNRSSDDVASFVSVLSRANNTPILRRDLFETMDRMTRKVSKSPWSPDDYSDFLNQMHDVLIRLETSVRSEIFRFIRYGLATAQHGEKLLTLDIHLILISCFDNARKEDTVERMQVLKIFRKFISIMPLEFPVAFARSLLATASQADDNFRRVSLETLRELSLANSKLVGFVGGFRVLVEAVIDPTLSDMTESIIATVLYLISTTASRGNINAILNIRTLISPFTEVDLYTSKDLTSRLASSKRALLFCMRTWVGLSYLTSDPLGLPVLMKLMMDPKIDDVVLECIVDLLAELLAPLSGKRKMAKKLNSDETVLNVTDLGASTIITSAATTTQSSSIRSSMSGISDGWGNIFSSRTGRGSLVGATPAPSAAPGNSIVANRSSSMGVADAAAIMSQSQPRSFGSLFFKSSQTQPTTPVAPRSEKVEPEERARADSAPPPLLSTSELELFKISTKGKIVENDFIYNLMDGFAGFLCSALLHVNILPSLCYLCSHGSPKLSSKCKDLLVNFLTIACGVFSESQCADLMEFPAIVEYASVLSSSNLLSCRSLKASELLIAFAGAFSVYNRFINTVSGVTKNPSEERKFAVFRGVSLTADDGSDAPKDVSTSIKKAVPVEPGVALVGAVASELKLSCKSRVDGLLCTCKGSSATADLMYDLRHAITVAIDKTQFSKQMDVSGVIGKDGKEPMKWDWATIDDMLEYSFKNPDRLPEALKTKWVKRVSGFYRCTIDDKAYFSNLDWETTYLLHLECASNMYHVLVNHELGVAFLGGDRRGLLFNEMSFELEQVVSNSKGWNISSNSSQHVFRISSCQQRMAREYFSLLGRMTTTAAGRRLLDSTQVFQHLSMLGHQRSLDYLSRLALTSLVFTDDGYFSRNLLQIFTTSGGCSPDLRFYTHTLMRALLRKGRNTEFVQWGTEMMFAQLNHFPTPSLLKVIDEACQDKHYLRTIVNKKYNLTGKPNTENICVRMCSLPEGIQLLKENNWLDDAISRWENTACTEYVSALDKTFAKAVTLGGVNRADSTVPIPVDAEVYHTNTPSSALECGTNVELQGLLRMPWNIEVKLANSGQAPNITTSISAFEYLKVDSFLDASALISIGCGDISSDQLRIIKVRGLILDNAGLPSGHPINPSRLIASCLLCGVCPVNRNGQIVNLSANAQKYAQAKEKRRQVMTQMKAEQERINASTVKIRSSLVSNEALVIDTDLPATFQFESLHDWSVCKPTHRCGRVVELKNDRFAVEIPGEPVVYIFSRAAPNTLKRSGTDDVLDRDRGKTRDDGVETLRGRRKSFEEGTVYLVEVQYHLRLNSYMDTFVPIPRHLFGELARSKEGCDVLKQRDIISKYVKIATSSTNSANMRRAALWCLGHIGSVDYGFAEIVAVSAFFVRYVIDLAVNSTNFSIRGTAFSVLGLLGRSAGGAQCLLMEQWEVSASSSVAVAFPRKTSVLFQHSEVVESVGGAESFADNVVVPSFVKHLKPFHDAMETAAVSTKPPAVPTLQSASGLSMLFNGFGKKQTPSEPSSMPTPVMVEHADFTELELECLNLISKLCGQIVYKESLNALREIKKNSPSVFSSRRLFVAVHELFGAYNFRLTVRRLIWEMFTNSSRVKVHARSDSVVSTS